MILGISFNEIHISSHITARTDAEKLSFLSSCEITGGKKIENLSYKTVNLINDDRLIYSFLL